MFWNLRPFSILVFVFAFRTLASHLYFTVALLFHDSSQPAGPVQKNQLQHCEKLMTKPIFDAKLSNNFFNIQRTVRFMWTEPYITSIGCHNKSLWDYLLLGVRGLWLCVFDSGLPFMTQPSARAQNYSWAAASCSHHFLLQNTEDVYVNNHKLKLESVVDVKVYKIVFTQIAMILFY